MTRSKIPMHIKSLVAIKNVFAKYNCWWTLYRLKLGFENLYSKLLFILRLYRHVNLYSYILYSYPSETHGLVYVMEL